MIHIISKSKKKNNKIPKNHNYLKKEVKIQKYKRFNKGYCFILNNGIIQFNYIDGIKILFYCKKPKEIIYINQEDIRSYKSKNDEVFENIRIEDKIIKEKVSFVINIITK